MALVMDRYDVLEEEQNLRYFSLTFAFSQFFGGLSVILAAIWMGKYGDGFGWAAHPEQQFHYHPLFMAIGMIFLYGESILVYRVFRHERKKFTKLLHVVLHSMVFLFTVVALKAVFSSHNNETPPSPNMYTLHSWVGMGTVLLFSLQYVCGFVTYFFPMLSVPIRQWLMPIHKFFGMVIFVLASCSAVMGISERAAWHINCWGSRCAEGVTANLLGLSIVGYALTVIYLVATPRFQRRPLPEEESVHQLISD